MSNKAERDKSEKLSRFFKESEEEELKSLVSASDKHGEFDYQDIKDNDTEDISPKVWGKAIEMGIIGQQGDKYKLNTRSEISSYLSGNWQEKTDTQEDDETTSIDEEELPDIDNEDAGWSRGDKAATGLGILGMSGFAIEPIRNLILLVVGIPLSPLMSLLPFFAVIFAVSIFTSIWSTLVRERIVDVDPSKFKEYIDKVQGDDGGMFSIPDDATEEQEDKMMMAQQNMMKAQMKPFGWTMCLTIPFVIWIFTVANTGGVGTVIFPIIGEFTWSGTVIGPIRTWIVWYASTSIVFGQVIKNLIDF